MRALAVLSLFLVAFVMFSSVFNTRTKEVTRQEQSIALNYVLFRQAVFQYVFVEAAHKQAGDIRLAALHDYLPEGWRPVLDHPWQARILESPNKPLTCVIWGAAPPNAIEYARRVLLADSFAIGRAENGRLVPHHGETVNLPAFVPEDNIVSVIYVD